MAEKLQFNSVKSDTPQIPHEAKKAQIMSTIRSFLLVTLLAGCPARYQGCVDLDSFSTDEMTENQSVQHNTEAENPKKKMEKYLGTSSIIKGKEKVTMTLTKEKRGKKEKGEGKEKMEKTLILKNGDKATLIMPIKAEGEYHIKYLIWGNKEGKFSNKGGIYKTDKDDIIAFSVPLEDKKGKKKKGGGKLEIVIVIKEENGKLMVSLPAKYNDKKVSEHFTGWMELSK